MSKLMSCIENYSLADTYLPSYRCLEREKVCEADNEPLQPCEQQLQELFLH